MSLPMGVVVLNCWVTETKETRTAMHGFLTHYIIDDINEFADLYNAEQSTRVRVRNFLHRLAVRTGLRH